jgi:hypothetical protein
MPLAVNFRLREWAIACPCNYLVGAPQELGPETPYVRDLAGRWNDSREALSLAMAVGRVVMAGGAQAWSLVEPYLKLGRGAFHGSVSSRDGAKSRVR